MTVPDFDKLDPKQQEAWLRAMLGPPNPKAQLAARAWQRCEVCGKCGRTLAADEPVRVRRVYVGGEDERHMTTPTCLDCNETLWQHCRPFQPPQPCDGCGRSVAVRRRFRPRR